MTNPLIHLNYRIWTLWTPDYHWSNWTPESCAKIPLFTSPIILRNLIYRFSYLFGITPWAESTHVSTHSLWEIDFGFDGREWVEKQTS